MKMLLRLLCIIVISGAMAMPGYSADKTIKMGTMSWTDLMPISLITKHVLEDAGYNVELTKFSEWGIAFAALRKNDVQILVSQVNYVAHDYWTRYKSRLERISPVSYGLYQAIAVPEYVDIDSLEQLNENADKFGGKIIGIEPGSGLMRHAQMAVDEYDLDDMRLVDGSTPAMIASLKSALDRKQWIAVTIWKPTWMWQKYDLKFLKDPKNVFAPPQAYYWVAHKGFSEQNAEARNIIASVYVPIAVDSKLNAMVNDGMSMQEAVDTWMENHQDVVKRWENN